ncbi:hypothetical protein OH76DRAFT_283041 [Lentinus brumalis]|uniref:Uncharacterized protein n=1 Tax=Lentinus brumalis TaxID=2498619 RepID=A0A371CKR0_9APHY|nr:hypothetical protein OH76DRAFT_283041 [Polyporus brumalis]
MHSPSHLRFASINRPVSHRKTRKREENTLESPSYPMTAPCLRSWRPKFSIASAKPNCRQINNGLSRCKPSGYSYSPRRHDVHIQDRAIGRRRALSNCSATRTHSDSPPCTKSSASRQNRDPHRM